MIGDILCSTQILHEGENVEKLQYTRQKTIFKAGFFNMFSAHCSVRSLFVRLPVTTAKKNENPIVPTETSSCQIVDKFRRCFGKATV